MAFAVSQQNATGIIEQACTVSITNSRKFHIFAGDETISAVGTLCMLKVDAATSVGRDRVVPESFAGSFRIS
jgi:hypothetical protein